MCGVDRSPCSQLTDSTENQRNTFTDPLLANPACVCVCVFQWGGEGGGGQNVSGGLDVREGGEGRGGMFNLQASEACLFARLGLLSFGQQNSQMNNQTIDCHTMSTCSPA